jgi:putative FmdB family regulatory protein
MPIYEFACPDCRKVFNFFSKRVNPERIPACPKCGGAKLTRQISSFSAPRGARSASPLTGQDQDGLPPMPALDDPKVMQAMAELERDMAHLDEKNPKHMAIVMRKMKDLMPPGTVPKDLDTAIKRLEAGESPEKIEEDMGDILGGLMEDEQTSGGPGGGGFTHDPGLYDY